MSPYSEMIRLYGFEQRKERMREAEQWRLCPPSSRPTWLARQVCRLSCWLGGRLVCAGQYLQALYNSRDSLSAQDLLLHGSSLRTDRSA